MPPLVEAHGFAISSIGAGALAGAERRAGGGADDLVAFVDDDAEVAPDWARRIAAPFADPAVGCVGGPASPLPRPRPRWLSERLLQYAGITRFDEARESRSSSEYPFGANVAFRRDALGGFRSASAGPAPHCCRERRSWRSTGSVTTAARRARARRRRTHAVAPERSLRLLLAAALVAGRHPRARRASLRLTLRLVAALPVRVALYAGTRDRIHMYRLAETTGYLRELAAR